jgi:ketosteroid isomerase-like protein
MRLPSSRTFIGGLAVVAVLCLAAALSVRSIVSATAGRGAASGRHAADSLPTVTLPPELDRVLRDYERHWASGDEAGLAALFAKDALLLPSGFAAAQGREGIRRAYEDVIVPVHLRALAYAADDSVGYVAGAYRFDPMETETGKFILALRRTAGGPWMISAGIENISHIMEPATAPSPR